jgi:heme a synthase
MTPLLKWLKIDVILTFILVVWGGIVRNSGAGLACPDWPLCHGQIIPPLEPLILLEWSHRLLASLVGFVTLGIAIAIVSQKEYRSALGLKVLIAIVLLIIQVILGGLTVMNLLSPHFVTVHLGVGLLFFTTLVLMLVQSRGVYFQLESDTKSCLYGLAALTSLAVFAQVLLGGWVASNHAGLACPDFPMCQGQWIPDNLSGAILYQVLHRVGALTVLGLILALFVLTVKAAHKPAKGMMIGILAVTLLQFTLGILNVFLEIPPPLSVAHLGMGYALFVMLLAFVYKVRHARLP